MPKINVLSKHVAELIAAGEVVERPANVVKEILENSIDAGSKNITLEIKHGGITFIRVSDDGCGISREDVPLAFMSHATSKIVDENSLNCISSLGFRGEALASISSVSKVDLITKTAEEEFGTHCTAEGGTVLSIDDAGCPNGTTLIIRDLFFNTPARMKFLKKDVAEANAVAAVIDRIALSHPEISFKFIREGKKVLSTTGDGKLLSAIYSVLGKEFADNVIEIPDYVSDGLKITGYISKPLFAKGSRNLQYFFVNNRIVKNATSVKALEEAYKNSIMVGKFPSCVLKLECNPEFVDVNIHPAKTEVRFVNDKIVFNNVYYAVKNALEQKSSAPVTINRQRPVNYNYNPEKPQQMKIKPVENFWQNLKSTNVVSANDRPVYELSQDETENLIKEPSKPIFKEEVFKFPVKEEKTFVEEQPQITDIDFRIIGEAFKTYIIVEFDNKLLYIDKHAAHERIIFERLKAVKNDNSTQILLSPAVVTFSKEAYGAVVENLDLITECGFQVEDFGAGSVKVRECPMDLTPDEVDDILHEFSDYLLNGKTRLTSNKKERFLQTVACKAAVKAGSNMSEYEMNIFVKKLLNMPEIRYCPHGRPVIVEMSRRDIEKLFGRV